MDAHDDQKPTQDATPIPTAGVAESATEQTDPDHNAPPPQPKLPPCDQCRRRKVKCQQTTEGPCDRCLQSSLTCTRDILRKKRGPKKGSGSVIAKLRNEGDYLRHQELSLPPFDLTGLDVQLPTGLHHRALSNGSADTSPLVSPIDSHFNEFGPIIDPLTMPRSVPSGLEEELTPLSNGTFTHGAMQFPSAWQMSDDQSLLQYPSPTSATGYVSVSDLAQQIFQETGQVPDAQLYSTSPMDASLTTPTSIGALLSAPVAPTSASPTGTGTSSPHPSYGPVFLSRNDSAPSTPEPRLQVLASEVGNSASLMSQCVKQYFKHLYPIMPILHQPSFMQILNQPNDLTTQEKILVLSLCAVTMTHACPPSGWSLQNKQDLGRDLLRQCLRLRHTCEWIEQASLLTIVASFFICVTYMELKQIRSHHFFLREAIGLAREMNGDLDRTPGDQIELICRKRMLALLFITERGCAILRNKPISMIRLPSVPRDYFDEGDKQVVAGFTALCRLFALLDENFVELWYATSAEDVPTVSPLQNVAAIQHKLNSLSFTETQMTDIQKADVLITHQWLRLIFWQASMRHGLITTHNPDEVFLYNYPITIARELCVLMRGMEYDAILVHGLGIFEKVFEVAYTLMDALTLAEIDWATSEDLRYLFRCLSASPNSHNTYVKVLQDKISIQRSAAQSPISQIGLNTESIV